MYRPAENRYDQMLYQRCGRSGLKLPAISLGLWHNFGGVDRFEDARSMALRAFDLGITHMDLANNYGPPAGSAEETFGRILRRDLATLRDEIIYPAHSKSRHGFLPQAVCDPPSRRRAAAGNAASDAPARGG